MMCYEVFHIVRAVAVCDTIVEVEESVVCFEQLVQTVKEQLGAAGL